MTITDLLQQSSKFSDHLLRQNILFAVIFRQHHIIFSLTTKLTTEIVELSYAESIEAIVFLSRNSLAKIFSNLESQFREKLSALNNLENETTQTESCA